MTPAKTAKPVVFRKRPSNMCAASKKLHEQCDGTIVIWKSDGQMNMPGKGQRMQVTCPCPTCKHPTFK